MYYTVYIQQLGEVRLDLSTVNICGFLLYISGYDNNRNLIDFVMDKFNFLEDDVFDCDYCHIISYTKCGVCTNHNAYAVLS